MKNRVELPAVPEAPSKMSHGVVWAVRKTIANIFNSSVRTIEPSSVFHANCPDRAAKEN